MLCVFLSGPGENPAGSVLRQVIEHEASDELVNAGVFFATSDNTFGMAKARHGDNSPLPGLCDIACENPGRRSSQTRILAKEAQKATVY